MTNKLVYGTVSEHPRKVIRVVHVLYELLDTKELDEIAEHVRERAVTKDLEQDAVVVVVQGDSKETLLLYGKSKAVTRVRTAMFNATLRWRDDMPD